MAQRLLGRIEFGPAIPKPPPPRANKGRDDWTTWKQAVLFPWLARYETDFGLDLICLPCSGCGAPGYLRRGGKPDAWGHWWRLDGLDVHHVSPRGRDPGQKYSILNCKLLCRRCHTATPKGE